MKETQTGTRTHGFTYTPHPPLHCLVVWEMRLQLRNSRGAHENPALNPWVSVTDLAVVQSVLSCI